MKGRKRHMVVDTEGLPLKVLVTEANYHDGTVASWLVDGLSQAFPRLRHIWADSAYQGRFETLAAEVGITVEIVQASASQVGFAVQARRWVVERSWAWLGHYRRLSKDFEYWMHSADTMIYLALTHLMLRRLARLKPDP